ncbi:MULTISPECIES: class I SAM-dependent methyltransferase [Thalassospira]|uniref:Methyltransferase domain-containing protein n=2 Tax=Thalassospira TaxID=168934 RepID=A0A367WAL9_9PROT|nr:MULTISPECIES: class I SAM-dependent methyltransferase [Thalassospira]MDG4720037.1 class I SAM-dependent methyltransferase [Thalassospira sp. FZY0004]RCK38473.1 hypothetical protein TH19_06665 [Thalassospira profundimaris]
MSSQLPSNWITQHCPAPTPGSNRALDLACGTGRHSFWLATQGWDVTAIDRDLSRTDTDTGSTITWQEADLEAGHWPLGDQQFDLIVVVNYLYRPLFDDLRNATRSGGTLIYQTFMVGNEIYGRPRSPDFLLHENELNALFADWQITAYQQGPVTDPETGKPASVRQAIVAHKP